MPKNKNVVRPACVTECPMQRAAPRDWANTLDLTPRVRTELGRAGWRQRAHRRPTALWALGSSGIGCGYTGWRAVGPFITASRPAWYVHCPWGPTG